MGITERKDREKLEMRRKIIEAAISMFLSEGYDKTSIRNIADKIEYSPATIYLYYKDKDELLYDVQAEAFSELYNVFLKKVTATDPFKRLEQLCHAYVWYGIHHPEMYDLMFIINAPMNAVDEKSWDNGEKTFQFLIDIIEKCIEHKLIRFTDKMHAALSIWSMGHGLISLQIRCRFKVMEMTNDQIYETLQACITQYLELIKS